jgi:hypothetical protein
LKTLLPIGNDEMKMLMLADDEFHVSYDASNDDNNNNDWYNINISRNRIGEEKKLTDEL